MSKKRSEHRREHRQSNHKGNGKSPESESKASLALRYAEAGIPVIPLHGRNKQGRCTCGDPDCAKPGRHPRTENGLADATADPDKIECLWAKWPSAKIGMLMGGPSKLVALVTEGKAGRQNLRLLTTRNGQLPRTVTIRDHHRRLDLFRVEGTRPRTGELADGVRLRGDRDFIVAPSRIGQSAGRRRFESARALGEVSIARAPDWLIADLTSAESADGQARSTLDRNNENAEEKLGRARAKPVPFHPSASIFPALAEERLHELAQDLKERGLVDPITLHEGRILDGRCRYLASQLVGIEPKFQEYVGDDPLGFVVSRNLHRRHLTESQRAMVAARLADLKRGANQHSEGLPIGKAADHLSVGERSVARAREVLRGGVPELVTAVEAGNIAVSAAAEISGMPESEQREIVASNSGEAATPDANASIKRPRKPTRSKTGKSTKHAAGANVAGDMPLPAEVEKLKSELAAANERQRKLEEELEIARVTALESRVASSIKISPDLEIPPSLDRRPLSADDQAAFDSIMAAWTNSAALNALLRASPVVQERFIATVRAEMASARSATN